MERPGEQIIESDKLGKLHAYLSAPTQKDTVPESDLNEIAVFMRDMEQGNFHNLKNSANRARFDEIYAKYESKL